ncbi:MAG: hypothetical protein ACKV2U_04445 [Bryobacteraceae bacterium]
MLKINTLIESDTILHLALIGDLREAELLSLAAVIAAARANRKRILLELNEVTVVDRAAMKLLLDRTGNRNSIIHEFAKISPIFRDLFHLVSL